MTEPHQVFGKNVVKLRMKMGITQETLSERAGISHRYLQSIEAGRKQPSINVVALLRRGLGCGWDELLKEI